MSGRDEALFAIIAGALVLMMAGLPIAVTINEWQRGAGKALVTGIIGFIPFALFVVLSNASGWGWVGAAWATVALTMALGLIIVMILPRR
ncbi:MAG: hypothetical protein ABL932_17385 [Terricaulis sp.]